MMRLVLFPPELVAENETVLTAVSPIQDYVRLVIFGIPVELSYLKVMPPIGILFKADPVKHCHIGLRLSHFVHMICLTFKTDTDIIVDQ